MTTTTDPDYQCGRCGTRNEKRAYGPGWALVCPDCGRSGEVHLTDEAKARIAERTFNSQSARDAQRALLAGVQMDESYLDYLDRAAQEHHDYFAARGDMPRANEMFTQSLGQALAGNDGD